MTPPALALVVPSDHEAARLDPEAVLGFASTYRDVPPRRDRLDEPAPAQPGRPS